MSNVFGPEYAAAYDLFYAKKDYKAECDVIERAFAEFSAEAVHRVLDLGCGTAVPDIVPYDAALMMFAVLGYQAAQGSVATALREVRRSLRTGGLFLFDVWHAPAVELEPPAQR